MSKYIVDSSLMTEIADNIRLKTGEEGNLVFPTGFNAAIESLPSIEDMRDIKDKVDDIKDIFDSNESEIDKTITTPVDIASFNDGADDLPIKELKVAVEPVQDLHGYDHPWPAGGGKNKSGPLELGSVSESKEQGSTYTDMQIDSQTRVRSISLIPTNGQQYTVSWDITNYRVAVASFDENQQYLGKTNGWRGWSAAKFTQGGSSTYFVTLLVKRIDEASMTESDLANCKIQLEIGSTATDYAPYSNICPISGRDSVKVTVSPTTDEADGQTYSITFPSEAGTVYGGTLDVTTGELVVDRAMVDMGSLQWTFDSNIARFISNIIKKCKYVNSARSLPFLSSLYNVISDRRAIELVPDCSMYASFLLTSKYTALYVHDSHYTDASLFTNAVTGQEVVLPLESTITYHLTPQEVRTLLGQNNIWADTGDINEIEYSADSQLCITNKLNELDSLLSIYTETQE